MFIQACKINSYVLEDKSNYFDLLESKNVKRKTHSYALEDKSVYFNLYESKYVKVKIKMCWHKKNQEVHFYHFCVYAFFLYFGNASD